MYDTLVWLRRYVPKNSDSPLWYYDYELKRLICLPIILMMNYRQYVDKINSGNYQPFLHILHLHISSHVYVKIISRWI